MYFVCYCEMFYHRFTTPHERIWWMHKSLLPSPNHHSLLSHRHRTGNFSTYHMNSLNRASNGFRYLNLNISTTITNIEQRRAEQNFFSSLYSMIVGALKCYRWFREPSFEFGMCKKNLQIQNRYHIDVQNLVQCLPSGRWK